METKNIIINNYTMALQNIMGNFANAAGTLNDNPAENAATIKTLNVLLEGVRSQTVLIQSELDNYNN